jgi:peptide/nickel transport system substrate-binding protein
VFALKQRYASFIENTTLGILPAHLWQKINADQFSLNALNIHPVGSGAFAVSKVSQDASGVPTAYDLKPFNRFVFGKPYLDRITLRFYGNENDLVNAFKSGAVNAINSVSSDNTKELAKEGFTVQTATLPRIFGLYFNQSQNNLFTDKNVVAALELAVSKQDIVNQALDGYGVPIDSPIPLTLAGSDAGTTITDQDLNQASQILTKDGWSRNDQGVWQKISGKGKKAQTSTLSFSISTSDTPELKNAATLIQTQLNAFGAQVDLKIFDIGTLNQNVIRPRKFDALFFGEVINHDTDLFAFWDSSQRTDPGLNIAQYASAKADKDLETASGTLDETKRAALYADFAQQVEKDKPAIFIESPDFTYVTRGSIKNIALGMITNASDRFSNAYQWYQNEDRVWPVFAKNSK